LVGECSSPPPHLNGGERRFMVEVGGTVVLGRGVSWWFLNCGYEHRGAVVVVVRQF